MKAEAHPRQFERLETLRRYKILDTPRESEFDEIVELASRICETPISVINLIDEYRQWFKAEVGLGARETPLDTSICSHVILDDEFVEISDTRADPRMADNPLCLDEPGLRFYAGAQLLTASGLPIGTLCVLDNQPRQLNDLQRQTLRVLSRQIMRHLELRLALDNQEIMRREMDHRVKNSLQTVGSLVRLYSAEMEDDRSRDAFKAVQRRIEAIAALHEQLHQTSSIERIALNRYVAQVVNLLQGSAPANVTVTSGFDEIYCNSSQATALAIIVSEFTANSIKHAFPDGRAGKIAVTGRQQADGMVEVRCNDDGAGSTLPQRQADTTDKLGLRLLEASASQMNAKLDHEATDKGFALKLVFRPQ